MGGKRETVNAIFLKQKVIGVTKDGDARRCFYAASLLHRKL